MKKENINKINLTSLWYTCQNMPLDIGHLQLLFAVLSISEATVCRQYTGNLEVDNRITIQAPSDNLLAASLLTCVSSCDNGCQCISYNSQTKMCRLYSSCDSYALRVSETDWKPYTIFEIQPSSMCCKFEIQIFLHRK